MELPVVVGRKVPPVVCGTEEDSTVVNQTSVNRAGQRFRKQAE